MIFARQVWTLTVKNLLIVLFRACASTPFRAFVLPVIFIGFLSYARNLFIPPSKYGIGQPTPLRTLSQALDDAAGGRNQVAFVNNGFTGGEIDRVISQVASTVRANGKTVDILTSNDELRDSCRSSLLGNSFCIAGVVFYSSPSEGPGGKWNYSLRADGSLGSKIVTDKSNNDPEIYVLPIQHAIDTAITSINGTSQDGLLDKVMEYPYTSLTAEERKQQIRIRYMSAIINILGVAIFIGMVGVTYQLTGLVATEREKGISQLIDCMMPNTSRWQPQAARFIAAHLALDLVYAPGWIGMAIILQLGVFSNTSAAISIIYHLLTGLSLSSLSIFAAAFFKKAQLSGIITVIACLLLGVISQVVKPSSNGAVAILGLLFPPMNYVFFLTFMARWEQHDLPTNLVKAAPENIWSLPGIVLWVFLIIQIIMFPILGAWVERLLYGTASKGRTFIRSNEISSSISLVGFTKAYRPNWFHTKVAPIFGGRRRSVLAVEDLTLNVVKGEIMALLGANGSGKSTTLAAIAGLSKITSGEVMINFAGGSGGLGLCPQHNVLWDQLTVMEHVRIFNRLKSNSKVDSQKNISQLIDACDLGKKVNSRSKTLSGGQKRKLQLAMMFTGGSSICCVDEVSSGLDPISRRKIWDILLAERGERTILLTTHFLDEADLLADHIAILSRGTLRTQGTSVELKHRLGSGYRIHVYHTPGSEKIDLPIFDGVSRDIRHDAVLYTVPDSSQAAQIVAKLEEDRYTEYRVSGPTLEDVFLKVAEEVQPAPDGAAEVKYMKDTYQPPNLLTGKRIGMARQAWILFLKRATVLRRNYIPYFVAFILPVIASGLVTLFLKSYTRPSCSGANLFFQGDISSFASNIDIDLVAGPSKKLTPSALSLFANSLPGAGSSSGSSLNITKVLSSVHTVDTLQEFNDYISSHFHNVTPGGFFLGDDSSPPTFAWRGDNGLGIPFSTLVQNAMDILLTNTTISTEYQNFDIPFADVSGDALQLITYFGLALSAYPAFFALYPTIERLRNVRALHYSNGVRPLPLWSAYLWFDFLIVLSTSILVVIIWRAATDAWYHLEYVFVVLLLYGLAATLLSYVISLFASSQLATFAFAAGGQAVMFLLYFIAYLSILTYAPTDRIDSLILALHFAIAAISPISNVTRSLFAALNVFNTLCEDNQVISYPGRITLYGGPILYLILQCLFLFGLLLWWESGPSLRSIGNKLKLQDPEDHDDADADISNELTRVLSSNDGLRVLNVSKSFGKSVAVDNVTFGVARGEVFALLGPNGAGKSTTISMIRGDIRPSGRGGEIFVENTSVLKHLETARSHMGVCPQFDAMDQMTTLQHLQFYARIRGIPDVDHNVSEVIRAVGLTPYANRMAMKLSGGNKRKLSLGIALMGNPTVLLLDEPSSGMDAAAKRVMWRTLTTVVPGRSLVLTTHSMEEADALANRAGIMSKKMLALGTTDYLRRKHGNIYYVHIVHKAAPHTSENDMDHIRNWVVRLFPSASIEKKSYHGQLRFSVPASSATKPIGPEVSNTISLDEKISIHNSLDRESERTKTQTTEISETEPGLERPSASGIGTLFSLLERDKNDLGFEYYSVSQTTLDQVFLTIVGKHNVEEEGG